MYPVPLQDLGVKLHSASLFHDVHFNSGCQDRSNVHPALYFHIKQPTSLLTKRIIFKTKTSGLLVLTTTNGD